VPAFHDLVVTDLHPLTIDATAITLAVPEELREAYRFTPGQHLTFRYQVDEAEVRRSFSICTTPYSGRLRVGVRLLPDGVFSKFVHNELKVGDTLSVMTPVGRFGPLAGTGRQPPPEQPPVGIGSQPGRPPPESAGPTYVAVVAGSGITPVMSIMTTILETEPAANFVLLYGNRSAATVMFAEEIADLKDRFLARLQVLHVFSREVHDSPLLSGRIDDAKLEILLRLQPAQSVAEWFVCGPAGLVSQTAAALARHGVPRRQLHTELFYTGDVPALPRNPGSAQLRSQVTVRLEGRTTMFEMPASGSLLDAVLLHRPDAPFSCKGGVCGTCRVRVIEGELEMVRNFALDQQDVDAQFRLACQSVPRTAKVSVDFDA
jgi:ring-1,2-phenylacetyl-CoA epoxidase subunit PaaE